MIEVETTADGGKRYIVRSELRGLRGSGDVEAPIDGRPGWPTFTNRVLAESALLAAWTKEGLDVWDLLQEVTVLVEMVRTGGEGQIDEGDMHRILEKRLRDLRDRVWTIVQEGPCTLFAEEGGAALGDKLAGSCPEDIAKTVDDEHQRLMALAREARKAKERPTFDTTIGRYLVANRPGVAACGVWLIMMESLEKLDGYAELRRAYDAGEALPERELALYHGRVLAVCDRLTGTVASATKSKRTKAARVKALASASTTKRKAAAK
jgi:hypothetical protein